MRKDFLYLALLLLPQTAFCRVNMPVDVRQFVDRRELCDHLRSEIPDEPPPEQIEAINRVCFETDKKLEQLKIKYRTDPNVMRKLNSYDIHIEATVSQVNVKITGMYSNMSYNKEGGDVLGIEVFLVYSRNGYRVVYQSSEGEPISPVVLPAKIDGGAISFSVPPSIDVRGNFTGIVEPTEIVGTFSSNGQTAHLPRRASYWQ